MPKRQPYLTRRDLLQKGTLATGAFVFGGSMLSGNGVAERAEVFEFPLVDTLNEKEIVPCIDENIAFSGTVRGVLKEDIDCDSFPDTPGPILTATITATGVGEETGTRYRYNQKGVDICPTTSQSSGAAHTFIYRVLIRIISEGPQPDQHLDELIHITVDGEGAVTGVKTEFSEKCRG